MGKARAGSRPKPQGSQGRGRGSGNAPKRGLATLQKDIAAPPPALTTPNTPIVVVLKAGSAFFTTSSRSELETFGKVLPTEGSGADGVHNIELGWGDIKKLLKWFQAGVQDDSLARLEFPTTLSKDDRAVVHRCIDSLRGKPDLASLSGGVGEDRQIVVCGAQSPEVQTARVSLTDNDQHKADCLYKWAQEGNLTVSRDEAKEMIRYGKFSTPELKKLYEEKSNEQKVVWHICRAIDSGDHGVLKQIIEKYPEVVECGAFDLKNGIGPLHIAAARGDLKALQMLLDAKAPPDALDGASQTPLEVARKEEQCEAEGMLISRGAYDVDKDKDPGIPGVTAPVSLKERMETAEADAGATTAGTCSSNLEHAGMHEGSLNSQDKSETSSESKPLRDGNGPESKHEVPSATICPEQNGMQTEGHSVSGLPVPGMGIRGENENRTAAKKSAAESNGAREEESGSIGDSVAVKPDTKRKPESEEEKLPSNQDSSDVNEEAGREETLAICKEQPLIKDQLLGSKAGVCSSLPGVEPAAAAPSAATVGQDSCIGVKDETVGKLSEPKDTGHTREEETEHMASSKPRSRVDSITEEGVDFADDKSSACSELGSTTHLYSEIPDTISIVSYISEDNPLASQRKDSSEYQHLAGDDHPPSRLSTPGTSHAAEDDAGFEPMLCTGAQDSAMPTVANATGSTCGMAGSGPGIGEENDHSETATCEGSDLPRSAICISEIQPQSPIDIALHRARPRRVNQSQDHADPETSSDKESKPLASYFGLDWPDDSTLLVFGGLAVTAVALLAFTALSPSARRRFY
eukprot:jgi/Botrbrau1/22930/Bobra.0030s0008.1